MGLNFTFSNINRVAGVGWELTRAADHNHGRASAAKVPPKAAIGSRDGCLKDRAAKLRSLPRWWSAVRYWVTFCRVQARAPARIAGRGHRRTLGLSKRSDREIAGHGVAWPRLAAPATPESGGEHSAGADDDAAGRLARVGGGIGASLVGACRSRRHTSLTFRTSRR